MSSLTCPCGEVIRDVAQSDSELLSGTIVRNKDEWEAKSRLSLLLAGLCTAYKAGTHLEWLAANGPAYSEQDLESIIEDMISRQSLDVGIPYRKCPACGNLLIRKRRDSNQYIAYSPRQGDACEDL